MALRWTGDACPSRHRTGRSRRSCGLNTRDATSTTFRAALALYGAPAQNFVYADVDGHIGYQLPGYIPIRSDPDDRGDPPGRPAPTAPASGPAGSRSSDLPWRSIRSTAGSSPPTTPSSTRRTRTSSARTGIPGYRAERIIDLINDYGQDGLTVPEMSVDPERHGAAPRAGDIVLLLWTAPSRRRPTAQTIAARIADWDGACDVDSLGCAAYMAWEYRVLRGIFDDDLGTLARDYVGQPLELGRA